MSYKSPNYPNKIKSLFAVRAESLRLMCFVGRAASYMSAYWPVPRCHNERRHVFGP